MVRLFLLAANAILWLAGFILFRRVSRMPGSRIAVLRSGSIGDLLIAVPAIRAIRGQSPNARINLINVVSGNSKWAAMGYRAGHLLVHPELCDGLIEVDLGTVRDTLGRQGLKQQLERLEIDRVVILPPTGERLSGALKKLFFLRLIGSKCRPSYMRFWTAPFFEKAQFEAGLYLHQAVSPHLAVTGGVMEPLGPGRIPEQPSAARVIRKMLAEAGIVPGRFLLVSPSAKFAHKRWPQDRFARVLSAFLSSSAHGVVFLGGEEDKQISNQLCAQLGSRAVSFVGRTGLAESLELARLSSGYFGNDTGPAHMAAAAGCPTITLFTGIHVPGLWDPLSSDSTVLRHAVDCQPCGCETHCPRGDMRCLLGINEKDAALAIARMVHH